MYLAISYLSVLMYTNVFKEVKHDHSEFVRSEAFKKWALVFPCYACKIKDEVSL